MQYMDRRIEPFVERQFDMKRALCQLQTNRALSVDVGAHIHEHKSQSPITEVRRQFRSESLNWSCVSFTNWIVKTICPVHRNGNIARDCE